MSKSFKVWYKYGEKNISHNDKEIFTKNMKNKMIHYVVAFLQLFLKYILKS